MWARGSRRQAWSSARRRRARWRPRTPSPWAIRCSTGAIAGECYFRGVAGERFAVRNSGAVAVGCEGATGGIMAGRIHDRRCVVVIGQTGRNFAAGQCRAVSPMCSTRRAISASRCNLSMVDLEPVEAEEDLEKNMVPPPFPLHHHGGDLGEPRAASTSWAGHVGARTRYMRLRQLVTKPPQTIPARPRGQGDPRRLGGLFAPNS